MQGAISNERANDIKFEEEAKEKNRDDQHSTLSDEENGSNGDSAIQMPYVKTPEEKRLLRKISYTFLPLVTWIVMVQFADKSALSISAVLGIYEDTGISGSQFSWLGSIFFLGYLIFQVPNQILVQKFPLGKYLGCCIIIWGAVMLFTALGNTFSQLAALRFLLGLFEATCLPCIYLIVAALYRREEHTFYFGVVTMCQGIGSVLGNFVAVGISHMGNQHGITMWRWNHIIFGALTVFLGILTFFFLVDNPRSKLLRLTEEEYKIVDRRQRDNAVVRTKKVKWCHMKEALTELRFYCICLAVLGINMQNGGLLVFSAQLIKSLGNFTSSESILLKIPGGVASTVCVFIASMIARWTNQIAYTGVSMLLVSLAGIIILLAIPDGPVKLLGYYLSWGFSGAHSLLAATVGSNVSGYSKKIFYNSCLIAASTIGSFIGPLIMLEHQAPRYIGGLIGYIIGNCVAIACFFIMRFTMALENKQRRANPPAGPTDVTLDLTDKEDKNFMYRL